MTRSVVSVRIEPGSFDDYRALAVFHYITGRPALPVYTLRAIDRSSGELAGVLVVTMPTLNGSWREQAWPGRFRTRNKKLDAARINRELRTIARVIVDPRFRACGVATRLVRTYLNNPLTPATEAIAAMGRASPFFDSAGMTRYEMGVDRRDARLIDALTYHGFRPWALLDNRCRRRVLRRPHLVRELKSWAGSRHIDGDEESIATAAGLRLVRRPLAYAHVSGGKLMSKKSPVPKPCASVRAEDLPHALTFYLRADERTRVLRALRRIDDSRERALVRALTDTRVTKS